MSTNASLKQFDKRREKAELVDGMKMSLRDYIRATHGLQVARGHKSKTEGGH